MIYRCKRCDHEVYAGCLPSVSCGLYFVALIGLQSFAIAVALPIVRRAYASGAPAGDGPPWWAWLLIVPASLVGLVVGAFALNALLEATEWLYVAAHRCPRCRGRRWSRGFTRGFGL